MPEEGNIIESMKNIILFQPAIGYMDAMRTKPSLPLSLLHAASFISRHYKVKIIDQRIEKNWKGVLKESISKDTICAGVTAFTGMMLKEGIKFSKYIKENYGIPVIWGGIHACLLPEQTVRNKNIDAVVIGEGEITFYELVKAIEQGLPLDEVAGICFKKNGIPVKTSDRNFINLNEQPDIPYHLVDINNYLPVYKGRKSACFQSSRGCPYKCSYCYNRAINHSRWRALSAEETLSRIKRLISKCKSIDDIYIVDDNFFIDLKRARKIICGLKELDVSWQVQGVDIVSLKQMDDSFIELLESSRCLRLTIGVESGSSKIRRLMCKEGTAEDVFSVMEKLSKHDIIVYCSFLMGIPGETLKDIRDTIKLLLRMLEINPRVRNSPFYIYTPYPGTRMYEKVLKNGFKAPSTLEEWAECEWDRVTIGGNEKFYSSLHFVSLFIDKKTREYNVPAIIKILTDAYRPLARYRIKNFYFGFMFEKYFFELIKKAWCSIKKAKNESIID